MSNKNNKYFEINLLLIGFILIIYALLGLQGGGSFLFCTLLLMFILKRKIFKEFASISYLVFFLYALIGLLYCYTYEISYQNTFGPYFDDSFYFTNAVLLSEGKFSGNAPTLFELLLSIPYYIFNKIGVNLTHLDLLPINFVISALSINVLLKILSLFFNFKKIFYFLVVISVVLNFNFLDSSIHLYRDPLLILLLLFCIYYTLLSKYRYAILFAVGVGLLRGANGLLAFMFILFHYYVVIKKGDIKKLIFFIFIFIIGIFNFADSIDGSILRGGIGGSEYKASLGKQLNDRFEVMTKEGQKGSGALRNSGTIGAIFFPIVYTISPLQIGEATVAKENYEYLQSNRSNISGIMKTVDKFYNIEIFFVLIHVLTLSYIVPRLFYGIYLSIKSKNRIFAIVGYYFIINVLLVAFISMQARHRMGFIILMPFFIYLAILKTKNKKIINLFSLIVFLVVIGVNMYLIL